MSRKKGMTKRQREIIEGMGWTISDTTFGVKTGYELSQDSPAGEDFSFAVEAETPDELVESVQEYALDFDPDDHIEMWVEARRSGRGGIPPIRQLVKDADDIDEMLSALAEALSQDRLKR